MIKKLFTYFAQFPSREGILTMAVNGTSPMPEYEEVLTDIDNQSDERRIAGLDNYAYGQSFEELQARIDKCVGSFLYADYGEFQVQTDGRKSLEYVERMAVTVAMKLGNNVDAIERMIASDRTLAMLAEIHSWLMADVENGLIDWADRDSLDMVEIVPFVASELRSIGWTLMFNATSPDVLGTHERFRSFVRENY